MLAEHSPLEVLSLMVAPAILTNASSVLVMSTTNRLARAADRARELAKQLEEAPPTSDGPSARRLDELDATERRTRMLLGALQSFYVALGCFATATMSALLGAVLVTLADVALARALEVIGLAAGVVALGALVHGSSLLVRETRIVVRVLETRAAGIRARLAAQRPIESEPR